MFDVEVHLPITLGQFVKLASLAETGGHARQMIADGEILVNGEVETRRGKKLSPYDVISIDTVHDGESFRVVPYEEDEF